MPAARSASRSSLWHRYLGKPRDEPGGGGHLGAADSAASGAARRAAVRRRHERIVSRSALQRRRDRRAFSTANGYAARRVEPRSALADDVAALLADGKGRRPDAGPDGVRSARARRPVDHRRRALAEDAVGDEPEDQVPRIVPAVRAGGPARARRRVVRARRRQPVHAARRRRAATSAALPVPPEARARCGASRS